MKLLRFPTHLHVNIYYFDFDPCLSFLQLMVWFRANFVWKQIKHYLKQGYLQKPKTASMGIKLHQTLLSNDRLQFYFRLDRKRKRMTLHKAKRFLIVTVFLSKLEDLCAIFLFMISCKETQSTETFVFPCEATYFPFFCTSFCKNAFTIYEIIILCARIFKIWHRVENLYIHICHDQVFKKSFETPEKLYLQKVWCKISAGRSLCCKTFYWWLSYVFTMLWWKNRFMSK